MTIRKAVIPAAGWGTRFLPVTKAQPKEMVPLVDKPVIQHVVEEAVAAGIQEIVFVTAQSKHSIEDHFDRSVELEYLLERKGDKALLEEMRRLARLVNVWSVRQKEQLGLGHAVLTAKDLVGNDAFAVFLPDDVFISQVPVMQQMLAVYEKYGGSVIAAERVKHEDTRHYGVIAVKKVEPRVYQVLDLVEKPDPADAPSDLAVPGRYILSPRIFQALSETTPGKGGEIQLTDGLRLLLKSQPIYACEFEGVRYDAGTPLGLLKASVAFGLQHPKIGKEFRDYLRQLKL